jgi:hypothetical protein
MVTFSVMTVWKIYSLWTDDTWHTDFPSFIWFQNVIFNIGDSNFILGKTNINVGISNFILGNTNFNIGNYNFILGTTVS